MSECSAAMLLMKLSCSPQYTQYGSSLPTFDIYGKPTYHNLPSPVDSSGASSFRSSTPSPPLSSSTGTSVADEGIVKDIFTEMKTNAKQNKPVSSWKMPYAFHYDWEHKLLKSWSSHTYDSLHRNYVNFLEWNVKYFLIGYAIRINFGAPN